MVLLWSPLFFLLLVWKYNYFYNQKEIQIRIIVGGQYGSPGSKIVLKAYVRSKQMCMHDQVFSERHFHILKFYDDKFSAIHWNVDWNSFCVWTKLLFVGIVIDSAYLLHSINRYRLKSFVSKLLLTLKTITIKIYWIWIGKSLCSRFIQTTSFCMSK